LTLRDLHEAYGHIQEIIIQNFRPKPGTRMAEVPAPSLDEHLWTIAMARLIFPASMNIQAPPNLSPGALNRLVEAGINDWGGVSPVTPDHVNPEAPWPHLRVLERLHGRVSPCIRLTAGPVTAGSTLRFVPHFSAGSIQTAGRAPTTGRQGSTFRCRRTPGDPPARRSHRVASER
jgi:hypothetical protein